MPRKGARIVPARRTPARASQYPLPPMLVVGVTADMAIMREEIFGPLLPVETYALDDAIASSTRGRIRWRCTGSATTSAHRARVLRETLPAA